MKDSANAADDMLADLAELGVIGADVDGLRAVLDDIAGLAIDVPEPSADVRALLGGAIPLRPRHRTAGRTSRSRGIIAVAVGALALGGGAAAAAANRLPDTVQEVVADATGGVIPHPTKPAHPVRPVNPPSDAPGHVKNKPKAPKPKHSASPKPFNTTAPGQIQKLTKPDPKATGPARPADPGSHGRAHKASTDTGSEESSDEPHSDSKSHASDDAAEAKAEKGPRA